jgi:hypothetical protein
MPYNLTEKSEKFIRHAGSKKFKGQKSQTLNDILEEGVNLSTTNFATKIGIEISNPEMQIEVDKDNFISLLAAATMIRTLQIKLLMSGNINNIKAFEANDLYKKCKTIETGLEIFKKDNFGTIPNFSGDLKSDDLELGSDGDEEKRNRIKENITTVTEKLVRENTLKSLELTKSNKKKVLMILLNSSPMWLALLNNTKAGFELMKQTPFYVQAARIGATVGLLTAISLVTGLLTGFAIPAAAGALGGTKIAGLLGMIMGAVSTNIIRSQATKLGQKIDEIGLKKEDNENARQRVNSIKAITLETKMTKYLLKELERNAKEYKKQIKGQNKPSLLSP